MDKIDFINELNKMVETFSLIQFRSNANNSLTVKIECGAYTAWLTLPCCYETVLNDSAFRKNYIDNLINYVMETYKNYQKKLLFCL